MARIVVTEESLRTTVDQHVFAQAVAMAGKVSELSAAGPRVEATVDGTDVSVRVGPGGLDARCACPAAVPYPAAPCPHAVAAVLAWVRAGPGGADPERAGPEETSTEKASTEKASTEETSTEVAVDLRAELDDVLGELATEAGDCDPDDGWYPDTADLEDLLDEVEDLADEAPDAARELAGHAAGRIRDVLAAGNCLTDDLADALTRAEKLRQQA
jgi:hypothetical protein